MVKFGGSVMIVAVALGLTACGGGATVDNQGQATVAPLSRPSMSSASPASGTGTATASPSESAHPRATEPRVGGGVAPAPKDQPAQEVSAVPTPEAHYSDREKHFLDELKNKGINVDGVEDQMLGAAGQVCTDKPAPQPAQPAQPNYLVEAIAGQLVEQKRSDKPAEEVVSIIAKAAQDAYC